MSFELVTQGLQDLIAKLNPTQLEPIIAKQSQIAAEEAKKRISTYPPAPTNSHRTGNLGRSWAIQSASGAAFLRSSASYAPFVVGSQQTAGASRIGWKTDEQVAQEITPDAVSATEQAIVGLLS